jgi:sec-independent protein translocase protein TatB
VFDFTWGEFLVIAVVALIVIGPKELPAVLRTIGQWTTKIRRMAAEFQSQFQEAMREAEMADLKKEVDNLNDTARGFTSQFDDPLNLKEATKWEPKPDASKPDDAKPEDVKADGAVTPADASPKPVPVTPDPPPHPPLQAGDETTGDEAFPVAADHHATTQTVSLPSPAGGGGKAGGAAADAIAAPPVTPPAAQPPLPEGSGQARVEGGVHS